MKTPNMCRIVLIVLAFTGSGYWFEVNAGTILSIQQDGVAQDLSDVSFDQIKTLQSDDIFENLVPGQSLWGTHADLSSRFDDSALQDWFLAVPASRTYQPFRPSRPGAVLRLGNEVTDTVPLEEAGEFRYTDYLQLAEERRALSELLQETMSIGDDTSYASVDPRAAGLGADGVDYTQRTLGRNDTTLGDLVVEMLGPRSKELEVIQSSLKDLRNYIAITQPKMTDMIISDASFHQHQVFQAAEQKRIKIEASNAEIEIMAPREVRIIGQDEETLADYFSFANIWDFFTAPLTFVFYGLILTCWAAWRYLISKHI